MRRPVPSQLELTDREVDALIMGCTTYDPRRLPARQFQPAERYVAALGQIVRRYREPLAWIREAGFTIELSRLGINGPPGQLDALIDVLTPHLPQATSAPYVFHYQDTDHDNFVAEYRESDLVLLDAASVEELLAQDRAADRIMEAHELEIDRGLSDFLGSFVSAAIFLAPQWRFTNHGLRYEIAGAHFQAPSPLEERPRSGALSRLVSRLKRHESPEEPWRGVEYSHEELMSLLDERIGAGDIVLRDFGLEGVVWPLLVVEPDMKRAHGLRRTSSGAWRLSDPMVVTPASRRFIPKAADRRLRSADELI